MSNNNYQEHSPEVQQQLKMYQLQQKGLLVLAGVVLGFFGRGLITKDYNQDAQTTARVEAPVQAANQTGGPPAPPAVDPKIVQKRLDSEALVSVIGNKRAKATIYEFVDFQCPACKGAAEQFLPQIKEQFIKTGKAKLVLVHWPLTGIHPAAPLSAKAALCAEKQGQLEKMHDLLYAQVAQWQTFEKTEAALGTVKASLIRLAKDAGLNERDFTSCISSNQYDAGLAKNGQLAFDLGAQGTPTFFINGKRMQSPEELATMIEEANR